MAAAVPAISVISGIYGVYSGVQQSKAASKAASKEEAASRQQAALDERQYQEDASRMKVAADESLADSRARAAASGTSGAGSLDIFTGNEEDKFNREIDWLLNAGKSRGDLTVQRGKNSADVLREQGKNAMWGSIGQGASDIGAGWTGVTDWWNS